MSFNSREMATELIKFIGLDPEKCESNINGWAAILDSALLAAHPEASDLECDLRDRDYDNEQFVLSTKQAEVMIASALETARREERKQCIESIKTLDDGENCDYNMALFDAVKSIQERDSLTEKEGPDAH